jgi:glycosyltransferase involved in cell wall biosynthesis
MNKETNIENNKKRVLLSGHLPPPMGGIAMFYQSLMNSTLPERVDLLFVQTSSQNRTLSVTGTATLPNIKSAFHDVGRFSAAVRKHRPQIAHIATAPGLSFLKHSICVFIARLAGSKVLIHPHCSLSVLYNERSVLWRWYVRFVIRRTVGLIALSREWKQISEIIPGHPVFMLPNAIDMQDYRKIAMKRFSTPDSPEKVSIFYLGYLGRAKGTFDLIEAARCVLERHSSVEFHLVGEQLNEGELMALNRVVEELKLGDRFVIHPPAYGADKMEFFQQADIFVYPSYYEGMPMAVIEAMASGLPVVATRVGGLPDLIQENENGLLVSSGAPVELADALEKLVGDHKKRIEMQQMSFKLAQEKYDIENLVERLNEIYKIF